VKKIDFLSSVFDTEGMDYLANLGIDRIKLSSYAITNLPLIGHCARYGLPIIMSTGGATLGEVERAVEAVNRYHNRLSLLHCSIKYPTKLRECNLAGGLQCERGRGRADGHADSARFGAFAAPGGALDTGLGCLPAPR